MANPLVISAGRLADQFHQDPIDLLDCDDLTWLIRIACARVVANDRKQEADRIKSGR